MGWKSVRDLLPTLVLHIAAAAVHLTSSTVVAGRPGPAYEGALALLLLVFPMTALLAVLSGHRRVGLSLLLASYVGAAGLVLTGHLYLNFLAEALQAGPSLPRSLFFISALLMSLLQIAGIVEVLRAWGVLPEPQRNRLLSK